MSCPSCHAKGASFSASFAQPYPHRVGMPEARTGLRQVALDETVQFCLVAATAGFFARHWARPVAAIEAGAPRHAQLAAMVPSACGACHAAQFADWQGSLYSRAMCAGVMGQLVALKDPADAR